MLMVVGGCVMVFDVIGSCFVSVFVLYLFFFFFVIFFCCFVVVFFFFCFNLLSMTS